MKNIFDVLKSMDKDQLNSAVKKAQEFVKTNEGKELVEKLKNENSLKDFGIDEKNKDAIAKALKENPDVAKKISDIIGRRDG